MRSQDNYSTCWIMAAMGSLESAVLRKEGLPLDFSENNLANHMSSRLDYEGMAPSELALAYYARWEGPVWESSDPYPRPGKSPPYLRAVRHLQEALFLPERQGPLDNDAVKWAVMTYGGVDAAVDFRVQDEFESWNASTYAYFNATRSTPNHHILVVGWDDAYPASNFRAGSRPPGRRRVPHQEQLGRRLRRTKGYLWVSYYDATFGDALVVFSGVEPAGNYDAVYQYDALGRSRWITAGGGEQAWFANRFTAAGTGRVAAVSFYAPVPGTAYEVRVARSLRGVAAAPDAATGTLSVAGYHTVRLERAGRGDGGGDVRGRRPRDDAGLDGARARGGAVRPHLAAGARGAVVRERRRFVVDGPDEPHGPRRAPTCASRRSWTPPAPPTGGRRGWRSAATWCGAARRR